MAKAKNDLYKFASLYDMKFSSTVKLLPGYNFLFGKLMSQKRRHLETR